MDPTLIAHHDVFSAARARASGLTPADLRRLLREGRIVRLHRGWYATRRPRDDADLHRMRVEALLVEYAGRAVATDASALLRLGIATWRPDLRRVHLALTDPEVNRHRKGDLVVHAHRPTPPQLAPRPASGTVHPAVAIAAVGLKDPRSFLVPADDALRRGLVTAAELAAAVDGLGRRHGAAGVRAVRDWCDPRHESPGETLVAHLLRLDGHRLEPQFVVRGSERWTRGGQGYRADLRLSGTRVLVEFDGRVKYDDRQVLWEEKLREDRIRSLGWVVVRVTMADLRDPATVRARVDAALALAAA
ncbi:type IV toxin-antitoxin system AbiEi family antitoxin domain-containing protein [Terrabacter sp. 2RAF25]|uniref:type IV toxin-antitoxin system AbiEi family antitoxin domain-containing protein n=1 Tax=Terrabacter sp. 2RAF25 TaxID=3232998 RepID=UPI003F99184B